MIEQVVAFVEDDRADPGVDDRIDERDRVRMQDPGELLRALLREPAAHTAHATSDPGPIPAGIVDLEHGEPGRGIRFRAPGFGELRDPSAPGQLLEGRAVAGHAEELIGEHGEVSEGVRVLRDRCPVGSQALGSAQPLLPDGDRRRQHQGAMAFACGEQQPEQRLPGAWWRDDVHLLVGAGTDALQHLGLIRAQGASEPPRRERKGGGIHDLPSLSNRRAVSSHPSTSG
nr:hypothetical protein [Microbacterium sp. MYb62]